MTLSALTCNPPLWHHKDTDPCCGCYRWGATFDCLDPRSAQQETNVLGHGRLHGHSWAASLGICTGLLIILGQHYL